VTDYSHSHPFWGSHAPLVSLTSVGLLITASGRTAFAIISVGALLWVYGWTVLVSAFGRPVFPQKGKNLVSVFLSSFFGSLYLVLLYLINPFLAMETTFLVILASVSCIAGDLCRRVDSLDPEESISRAVLEALILGSLIIALALIREPLGFGSLSVPGGARGIIELFGGAGGLYFPVRIIAGSAGGFLLLGYGLALFRYFRKRFVKTEDPQ
jgi:hypothetical protein